MAQSLVVVSQEPISSDNSQSISTKEFLNFERTIEAYKDSDEEIKLIFREITKLSAANPKDDVIDSSVEDVDLILKRAEDIALETKNLLSSSPIAPTVGNNEIIAKANPSSAVPSSIPQIKVTKPEENKENDNMTSATTNSKISPQHKAKNSPNESRRKTKARPFSAGVAEAKKKGVVQKATITVANTQNKSPCKHDALIEELKDTAERVGSLEFLNVQLTEDNRALRKRLDQVSEQKHVVDLKLAECEKFIGRLGKQYENKNHELKAAQEKESHLLAELNKEKSERKNLTLRHDKDAAAIQDLQRQVKEMEMILRRKHPDSVSALIVASKSSAVEDNKKKLLEDRISRLEQELKDKETHFQGILLTLQEKFGDMKQKYENHIVDIERQLMEERKFNTELKNKINRANMTDTAVQTVPKAQQNFSTQTVVKIDRASSATSRLSQNSALLLNKLKEDSYLIATIKGLQTELTAKQRTITKINRESEELKKNLRNLQKEKEVLLNLNPQKRIAAKQAKSTENIISRMNSEMEAEIAEARKQKDEFTMERKSLLDSLKRSNEELIVLKKKRIQDLHTLQLAHEKELMQMNMQLYPLQEEIKLLNRTIEILQERVRATEDKLLRYQGCMKDMDMHGGGDNPSSRASYRTNYN